MESSKNLGQLASEESDLLKIDSTVLLINPKITNCVGIISEFRILRLTFQIVLINLAHTCKLPQLLFVLFICLTAISVGICKLI